MTLYYPPQIKLEILSQDTIPEKGFLRVLRSNVKAHYTDESVSAPFIVDSVVRDRLDAVTMISHFYDDAQHVYGQYHVGRYVYLRSAIRPALVCADVAFGNYSKYKRMEDEYIGNTYELPAGLVELDEVGVVGLQQAAARELEEEIGFTVEPSAMKFLGHRIFPTVGMSAERIFFLEVEVNPMNRKTPTLDGHPMEEGAIVQAVLLSEAMEMVRKGYLPDAKTEIGLQRLADKYGV